MRNSMLSGAGALVGNPPRSRKSRASSGLQGLVSCRIAASQAAAENVRLAKIYAAPAKAKAAEAKVNAAIARKEADAAHVDAVRKSCVPQVVLQVDVAAVGSDAVTLRLISNQGSYVRLISPGRPVGPDSEARSASRFLSASASARSAAFWASSARSRAWAAAFSASTASASALAATSRAVAASFSAAVAAARAEAASRSAALPGRTEDR
ncbi:hypothetical protein AB0B45_31540 [Nonomuraea sp. NPDC049152]|uniref:hypothetical protein n=1 Tax=Nonomuraea sp. NPDC049152 TaxID=3154350 RepID=UPI0033C921C7